ncbi:hypothetical protein D3C87_1720820 [compost metagenome]
MEWVIGDDTGMSSKSIAAFMCGADVGKYLDYPPADPADLGRCLRLLERFPEWKSRTPELASISKRWAKIIPHWNEAARLMDEEVGIYLSKGNKAPRTYAFMKEAGF